MRLRFAGLMASAQRSMSFGAARDRPQITAFFERHDALLCPATIVQAELWKMGQLRPGDKVRFSRLTPAEAVRRLTQQ